MRKELDTIQNIGKKIKLLRKYNYLTQEQLAEKSNVSMNAIAKAETGRINLSLNILDCIAKVLNVDVSFFIFKNNDSDEEDNISEIDIYLKELLKSLNETDKAFIIDIINSLKIYYPN